MSRFSIWSFMAFLVVSIFSVIHLLKDFFAPFIMALVIVSIFRPLHVWVNKKITHPSLSSLVTTVIIFVGVLAPLVAFFLAFTQEGLSLFKSSSQITSSSDFEVFIGNIKESLSVLQGHLNRFGIVISTQRITAFITSLSEVSASFIYQNLKWLASNLFFLGLNFCLTVIFVFVFLSSGQNVKGFFMDLLPLPKPEQERLITRFKELSAAVFLGNGLISLAEGIIGGTIVYFFNIPGALILGFLMAILAFLPLIGASGVVIPVSIFLFLTERQVPALVFLLINFVQLGIFEFFVKPKIIGHKSQMHEILVFLSIISGVQIYGMLGFFYGPLLITFFLTLSSIYKEHYKKILF